MIRYTLAIAIAGLSAAVPAYAQNDVGQIVGGIARQYINSEQEKAAYAQAQSQNTVSAYRSFLRQFPDGAYAAQARDQIRRLGGSTGSSSGTAEASSGSNLSAQQRAQIQQRLTALGYDTSGTDGSFGPGTRRAIALWQRDRNYSQTGTLTSAQSNEILRGRSGGSTASASAPASATGGSAAQVEAALGLSRSQRSVIQAGLTQRGFDTRGVDGSFGQGTRNAIAGWQRANDFSATGYLTAAQVQRLSQ